MANPLEQTIASAIKANDTIGRLFSQVGTSSHPRGFVTTAYRNALRAMKAALREPNALVASSDVLAGLKRSLELETRGLFTDARAEGTDEAARQLSFYGIQTAPASPGAALEAEYVIEAVLARFTAQETVIRALILTNASEEQIIGSDERVGAMRSSDIAPLVAVWAATLFWSSFAAHTQASPGGNTFQKQAIAAIDARTTDCCLRVNGQVQPLNGQFTLTGFPRYADLMDWSPFHNYCRTSIALYLPQYDFGLTLAMRSGADRMLAERAAGIFTDRHPADAFG